MITGYVDEYEQAKVPIAVLDSADNTFVLDAVVDTGFSGHLCISIYEMDKIALSFWRTSKFELGDGRPVKQNIYRGQAIFDDQRLLVNVLVSKSRDTLIGSAFLVNKKLEVDYTNKLVRIRNSRKKK